MKKVLLYVLFGMLLYPVVAQQRYRVVFYNVENLYDTSNDPLTLDDDFTPEGKMGWTEERYHDKLSKLSRTLFAAGKDCPPVLIGLAEIENRQVVEALSQTGQLAAGNYGVVHKDSPDARGIDVALLYCKDAFRPIKTVFYPVPFPEDSTLLTRDILYTAGVLGAKDTVHLFVCHFPSMYGGEEQSEWKRERAASVLKTAVDSIYHQNTRASILIMGDMNGMADRPALTQVLNAIGSDDKKIQDTVLYNTGYYLLRQNEGSYKYRGHWQTIDHIIVSGNMLNDNGNIKASRHLQPFNASFLLETEKDNSGVKPYRTYMGPRYWGGYSDHLPVFLELKIKN